jgi:transcriptional regulator with XRE-family HTH domain
VKYTFPSPATPARQIVDTLERRFGAVIRRLRVQSKLGQEDFAHKAGLHRTHVSMIERGLRSPTLAVIQKLAAALSTSMATLLEETERAEPEAGGSEEPKLRPGRRKKQARRKPAGR